MWVSAPQQLAHTSTEFFLSNAINSFSEDLRAACCSWAGSSHETYVTWLVALRPQAFDGVDPTLATEGKAGGSQLMVLIES